MKRLKVAFFIASAVTLAVLLRAAFFTEASQSIQALSLLWLFGFAVAVSVIGQFFISSFSGAGKYYAAWLIIDALIIIFYSELLALLPQNVDVVERLRESGLAIQILFFVLINVSLFLFAKKNLKFSRHDISSFFFSYLKIYALTAATLAANLLLLQYGNFSRRTISLAYSPTEGTVQTALKIQRFFLSVPSAYILHYASIVSAALCVFGLILLFYCLRSSRHGYLGCALCPGLIFWSALAFLLGFAGLHFAPWLKATFWWIAYFAALFWTIVAEVGYNRKVSP